MNCIYVETNPHPYPVVTGTHLAVEAGLFLREFFGTCSVLIVTDDTVANLYADIVVNSLSKYGFCTAVHILPHGETSKNPANLIEILEHMASEQLTRTDLAVALGGGVVGDITGLAASMYLRGIRYVQIPTTLLAAVDSSVGGKCAVDLSAGKNLAGAFWQPSLVLCDTQTLNTLPADIFADGCAEVIKYGVLGCADFFASLEQTPIADQLEAVIASCVKMKRDIVVRDERDTGERQLLNLGHTAAHAIEKCANFTVSHGKAVAIGILTATKAAIRTGVCTEPDCIDRIASILRAHNLPTTCPFPPEQLATAALADKKRAGATITLVLPKRIGECVLHKIPIGDLSEFFQ